MKSCIEMLSLNTAAFRGAVHDCGMGKKPFLTIITAAMNSGKTIRQTLISVKSQGFQSLEHIVIDGGSQDETIKILQEFEGTYNLCWRSEPDDGISDAMNKAVKMANGRYILVIQADDRLISADVIKKIYPLLRDEGFDIYSFPVLVEAPDGRQRHFRPFRTLWWYHFKTIFPHQGVFVHRRLYNRIGGYRKEFAIGMDYDFFYRSLQRRASVCFGSRTITVMGDAGVSSSLTHLNDRIREEYMIQKINEKNLGWRLVQLIFHMLYFPYKTRVSTE